MMTPTMILIAASSPIVRSGPPLDALFSVDFTSSFVLAADQWNIMLNCARHIQLNVLFCLTHSVSGGWVPSIRPGA